MKKWMAGLAGLLTCLGSYASNNDSLLNELGHTIRQTAQYDRSRLNEIARLRESLPLSSNPGQRFERARQLYEVFKIFNYDSAYNYARLLVRTAREMNDSSRMAAAQLNLSFILLSAGLYKETYDSLHSLSTRTVPDSLKGDYYTLWGRYYYDLAGYANDHYHSVDYDIKGNLYMDSALAWYPKNSFEHHYYSGLKNFKQNKIGEAAVFFKTLMQDPGLDDHQLALTASTLSGIYLRQGNQDEAIALLIRATIADIHSSTKETVAIFHLAELLHKKGDLKHAVLCIESAISNAEFYGARQRKLQASSILPLIEGERINGIEAQKTLLVQYAVVVTLLVLVLLVLAWIIWRQVKKLKLAQRALTAANTRQQLINQQLEESNHRLAEVNDKLEEANKIKEEYIGYFFNMDSAFYSKLEKIKSTIDNKLREKRYEDIRFFLDKIEPRKEKEELLLSFDTIFLKLFPHFVDEVKSLLREDEKIGIRDGEVLSTDLRIYALMRMGVTDPEKIASILEYSVKTIYSYKSRLKSKALLPEEFEERVLQIKSI